MKQNIMQKWVAALRSGEYQQGQTALNIDGKFCCLGVLCELALKDGVEVLVGETLNGNRTYDDRSGLPPTAVIQWAGMRNSQGKIMDERGLDAQNDNGASFNDIANFIEQNWEQL